MPRISRLAASALIVTSVVVAPARPALALVQCDNTSPPLGVLVTCINGNDIIDVPATAVAVQFSVTGGGGGGSVANQAAPDGGRGARITGWAQLPGGAGMVTQLNAYAGRGGAAGVAGSGPSLGAGEGGRGSMLSAIGGPGVIMPIVLVAAGAGGGAGGRDTVGDLNGAGGDAGLLTPPGTATAGKDAGLAGGLTVGGGGAADRNAAGAGGAGAALGGAGTDIQFFTTTPSPGGGGGMITGRRGGAGGGGYNGGGGGGADQPLLDKFIGGGGGGGSSYVDSYSVPNPTAELPTSGAGMGGSGSLFTDLTGAQDGADGVITLKFTDSPPPQIASLSPTSGSRKGGGVLTVTGFGLDGATGVTVGGAACPVLGAAPSQVTCVLPAGTPGSAQNVVVTTPIGSDTRASGYTYNAAAEITGVSPASGRTSGGQTLTISGVDLTGTSSVSVGGQPCTSVHVTSDVEVTCQSPASVTTGVKNVTVTGANGSDTKSNAFTYVAEPAITKVEPTGGRLSGGETITITGTDLTGATTVTVGGQPCTSLQVSSGTEVTCQSPPGSAGARDVTLTSPTGSDTETGGFTYHPLPTVASVSPEAGDPAGGETLTITGTALGSTSAVTIDGAACTGIVAGANQVTCVAPAAVHGPGRRDVRVTTLGGEKTLEDGYRYTGPPVIASVMPTAGPQDGGNSLTIVGADLDGVAEVRVGNRVCTSMSPSASSVTCVVPSAATPGVANVEVSASAGSDVKPNAYEYLPHPTTPPAPTPQPTTPQPTAPQPTTAPTTPPATTPPPTTPAPAETPQLNLELAIRPGAPVAGAAASVSGGGLRANSQYIVTMYSSPVRLASGYADDAGAFTAQFKLPPRACVKGGLHRVVLSGFAPDGTVVTATNWLLFDDSCTTRAVSPGKPAVVTYGTFRFDRASAALTPYVKSVLKRTHTTLNAAKRVTITGYTETGSKSEVSRRANKALALKRAQAARDFLRKLGVKAPITVVGAGAVSPLKGRPQAWNRRVFISAQY